MTQAGSLIPDIEAADMRASDGTRTLPASYYTDPAIWELEKTEIFFRTWQYACHASQLDAPGRFVTMAIFDQEVFLICDGDGEVRAFFNVCLHRGHPLVEGNGRKSRLVCPYHAWTYDLEGRLVGARGAERSGTVPKSEICLSPVRVERLLDFYFINLDPHAASLMDHAGELADSIAETVPDLDDYRLEPALEYVNAPFACNWKVLIDNQLECYHCENAHPGFSEVMDIGQTRNFIGSNLVRQHIPTVSDLDAPPFPYERSSDVHDGNFWTLFPNTILARLPGSPSLSISRLEPQAPDRTTRVIQVLSRPDADRNGDEERLQWLRDGVIAEDRALCEAVQRGMKQIGFSQGYYAVDADNNARCEEPVRFFHQRYLEAMGRA